MRTDDLVKVLSEDRAAPRLALARRLGVAVLTGGGAAVMLLLATIGLRADLGPAMLGSWRLPLKVAIVAALALSAAMAARRSAEPMPPTRASMLLLLVAPALLMIGLAAELSLVPASEWTANLLGANAGVCIIAIPLLALAPLAALIAALRQGAPASPALAGTLAGVSAAGLGAVAYALRCPDDSPLFVAVWYVAAIAIMALIGRALGAWLLRW